MDFMYLPSKFKNEDEAEIIEIIEKYPFATVISTAKEGPFISHLPLVLERRGDGRLELLGHLARANPHWRRMSGSNITVIFHGPHSYITPQWYVENDVPTWNYSVVHIQGQVELIEDRAGIVDCLRKLTTHAEAGSHSPWQFWIPEDLQSEQDLCLAIVGFRVLVEEMNGKFKLSQNRSEEDRRRVIEGLDSRTDQMSREISRMMKKRASFAV